VKQWKGTEYYKRGSTKRKRKSAWWGLAMLAFP